MGKKRKITHKLVLVLMTIALLWFAGSWGKTLIGNFSVQTMIVSSSNTQKSYDTLGLVCVEEVLLHTDMNSEILPLKAEGEKVAKNRAVCKVVGEDGKDNYYYAPCSGIVSYEIDGYEQIKSSDEVAILDFSQIQTSNISKDNKEEDVRSDNTEDVTREEYRVKIINNMTDVVLYVILPKDEYLLDLEIGTRLKIELNDANGVKTYRGKVTEKTDCLITSGESFKECYVMALNIGVVDEEIYLKRIVDMKIVYDETKEMVIPKSALVYHNEEAGVYYLKKKFVVWQEVAIIKESGENVIIEGLEEGTEIVINPGRVTEGKYIR